MRIYLIFQFVILNLHILLNKFLILPQLNDVLQDCHRKKIYNDSCNNRLLICLRFNIVSDTAVERYVADNHKSRSQQNQNGRLKKYTQPEMSGKYF